MKNGLELAINGGNPVRKSFLPYGRQWIDEKDINEVVQCLKSDFLTTGPKVREFEENVSEYVGSKYAVSFSNGTAALHAACFAAGITSGDEVITTPLTFVASANCIIYNGAVPVFADIDPSTYNICPEKIEKKITPHTKAIIPVHFSGQPVELDQIHELAYKYDLIVIEDAAHALGAAYKKRKIGSISDMTMFSFHPVKHITTGEGGVITTNCKNYYDKLIQFRSHGITRNLPGDSPDWFYEMQFLGYNYRLTDIQAALGISQLKKSDTFLGLRRNIVEKYNAVFLRRKELCIPYQNPFVASSWHLYVIRLRPEELTVNREIIFNALVKENVGVNVHYIPVYFHPFYEELGYSKGLCPEAERIYEEIITLPLFPAMSQGDVDDVIAAVNKVIQFFSKG